LRQLSGSLSVGTGLPPATLAYLRKRIESLSPRERLVSIMIDELYSARQVKCMNGHFFGNKNGQPTKTLLCMMLKSVAGKYSDIVAMVPLTTISSTVIRDWWYKVDQATTPMGFDIVATIIDAHSSNIGGSTRRSYVAGVFILLSAIHLTSAARSSSYLIMFMPSRIFTTTS
jgi:hypothetical protein